ncbi:unnamed protein product [Penicillium camemberti]|uniref:Str. FM013 n=1 Tax=Penicillium camemberti (strain FM 013) TaxID=1429867 RepID=A0A0G4PMZ3_PENC3|nr:unnamed protein product [Penicillium camemberti]
MVWRRDYFSVSVCQIKDHPENPLWFFPFFGLPFLRYAVVSCHLGPEEI